MATSSDAVLVVADALVLQAEIRKIRPKKRRRAERIDRYPRFRGRLTSKLSHDP
jgi:hypothetical protein